jgi:hypothetical protein
MHPPRTTHSSASTCRCRRRSAPRGTGAGRSACRRGSLPAGLCPSGCPRSSHDPRFTERLVEDVKVSVDESSGAPLVRALSTATQCEGSSQFRFVALVERDGLVPETAWAPASSFVRSVREDEPGRSAIAATASTSSLSSFRPRAIRRTSSCASSCATASSPGHFQTSWRAAVLGEPAGRSRAPASVSSAETQR